MGSDSRAYSLRVVLFLIANSMESEPRVVALAQLHKTCGALDFSFALVHTNVNFELSYRSFFKIKKHRMVLFYFKSPQTSFPS